MKIDRNKLKKCTTEVPTDCKALIEKLKCCSDEELLHILQQTTTWTVGKCELYHWVDILDRFDALLGEAASAGDTEWCLKINSDQKLHELIQAVLHFTSLLIEYSFSRHLYSSVEHLISLLSAANLDIILSVLNLLYVFSKRSNFLSRLTDKQKLPLLKRLGYLAESWGGKENGFGLAESCKNRELSSFPPNATTLDHEFYAENKNKENESRGGRQTNNMVNIKISKIHEKSDSPAKIMEQLCKQYSIPQESKMVLYTRLRLAHSFAKHSTRLKCVQARLHAISVLVYTNSIADNINSILYSGFTEELVDLLQAKDESLVDIKAAALRTLTSIVHLDCRDRTPRLGTIVDVTGVSQYHGFLPVLVRRCIDSMTSVKGTPIGTEFPHSFATALFSFLYHLSSYESGGIALVQSGMMGPLLSVVTNMGDQQEQTTFVTRAVRVIDLITNIDWQAFQAISGLQVFIDRLEHEVSICRRDAPPACDSLPAQAAGAPGTDVAMDVDLSREATSSTSGTAMETEDAEKVEFKPGSQCLPQRAALFKSVLNFLKKAIVDQAFGDQVRHMMDGTLPSSLKHIIGNVEYYGPALFLLAMEVVTVYVFQEPSLLSSLQDNRLTYVMLHALLVKKPPATREVLASLPNIFSALCLNSRGLQAFVNCDPFERLFHVMLSPDYLLAMRRRRSVDPIVSGDTASNLGNAMDELMRHQPILRGSTMTAIIDLLKKLKTLGNDSNTICSRTSTTKSDPSVVSVAASSGNFSDIMVADATLQPDESTVQADEGSEDEVEEVDDVSPTTKPQASASSSSVGAGGTKKPVPLLDYMTNVTKFINAIVSNNTTDDHCNEFRQRGGIPALLDLLRLSSLPLDFSSSYACQSVLALTQTTLVLLRDPDIVQQSLKRLEDILVELTPLTLCSGDQPGSSGVRPSSVLLNNMKQASFQSDQGAANRGGGMPRRSKLVQGLVHLHAYITLFLHFPRALQVRRQNTTIRHNDIRQIIVKQWASPLGIKILDDLNLLYRGLIWESTLLLNLCAPGYTPESEDFGVSDLIDLVSADEASTGGTSSSNAAPMDVDSNPDVQGSNRTQPKIAPALAARIKSIKPVLLLTSKIVRSLAELFGLLVKIGIARNTKPLGPRSLPNATHINQSTAAQSRDSRALASSLSKLLSDSLKWESSSFSPPSRLRITFFICTVGFTSPMLFDEKRMPYHLMLQYFIGTGAHTAFFDCFKWVLKSQCDEKQERDDHAYTAQSEIPGTLADFLEPWLALVERLVNPKNIMNSPHLVYTKIYPANQENPPPVIPFSAAKFLVRMQKETLTALQHLWSSGCLPKLSSRICDSVILILCHLIRGEQMIRDKLLEEKRESEKKNAAAAAASSSATSSGSSNPTDAVRNIIGYPALPSGGEQHDPTADAAGAYIAAVAAGSLASSAQQQPQGSGAGRNENQQRMYVEAQALMQQFTRGGQSSQAQQQPQAPPAPDPNSVQQLMDMGFSRELVLEALSHNPAVEGATEWLLTHSNEEEDLLRAISMSLENAPPSTAAPTAAVPAAAEASAAAEAPLAVDEDPARPNADEDLDEEFDHNDDSEDLDLAQREADNFANQQLARNIEAQEEKARKQMRVDDQKKMDEAEINKLSQDEEEPMSSKEIEEFAMNIFEGSLQLVNQLPDTVYRVCDMIVVLMKRAGKAWSDDVLERLVKQVMDTCMSLQNDYNLGDSNKNLWHGDDSRTNGLATQALLFALLFEEMKESCARIVASKQLVPMFVRLLASAARWLETQKSATDTSTPKWVSPVLLLIDLYERTCVTIGRRAIIEQKYRGCAREWKWFDDRLGKWCSYSSSNHKSIDDAYKAGEASIRFAAGRRRYLINFHQLIQFNEETGNRRPIMAQYTNPPTGGDDQETAFSKSSSSRIPKSKDHKSTGSSSSATSSSHGTAAADEPATGAAAATTGYDVCSMETDALPEDERTSSKADVSGKKSLADVCEAVCQILSHPKARLNDEDSDSLVHSCTALIRHPVDADTLHSSMRLLLRLTRNGQKNGQKRALLFAKLGGPAALLQLRRRHGFIGFPSLATLLIRHVLEDDDTLRSVMERSVRSVAATGAGNSSCGVTSSSVGSQELHYVLRALAPAACHNSELFTQACLDNIRIQLPDSNSRNVDQDETALMSATAVQRVRCAPRSHSPTPPANVLTTMTPMVVDTIKLLLNALVEKKLSSVSYTDSAQNLFLKSSVSTASSGIASLTGQASGDVNASIGSPMTGGDQEEASAASGFGSCKALCKDESDQRLVIKSSILRLLAELVRSYPTCASLVANHQYKADASTLITQDCSCLAFILDHLLVPRLNQSGSSQGNSSTNVTKATDPQRASSNPSTSSAAPGAQKDKDSSGDDNDDLWDRDCPALARVLIACVAASYSYGAPVPGSGVTDIHAILVSEMKGALSRAVQFPESKEKHLRLRALLEMTATIIECTSKNSNQSTNRLVNRNRQDQDGSQEQNNGYMPRLMVRRGLAADLAKVTHFIDLGSAEMPETINAALRPLEILTRWSSVSQKPQSTDADKKSGGVSEPQTSSSHDTPTTAAPSSSGTQQRSDSAQQRASSSNSGQQQEGSSRFYRTRTLRTAADVDYALSVAEAEASTSGGGQQRDDSSAAQQGSEQQQASDVFMEPLSDHLETISEVDEEMEDEQSRAHDAADSSVQLLDDEADDSNVDPLDDTVRGYNEPSSIIHHGGVYSEAEDGAYDEDDDDGDDDDDDDDDDDEDDDDEEDEDDLDDGGSEMDTQDMDEEENEGARHGYNDSVNYDSFVYDLMSTDLPGNDLFIQLEDIFGGLQANSRNVPSLLPFLEDNRRMPNISYPYSSNDNRGDTSTQVSAIPTGTGQIASCHPLLVRHANHASVTDSSAHGSVVPRSQSAMISGGGSADGWSHRVMRAGFNLGAIGSRMGNTTGTGAQTDQQTSTIHLHYTGTRQPRNPPMVLQRLLGPSVAQDILQLSSTLYSEGGGRAQVVVNDMTQTVPDDIIDGVYLDNMFQHQGLSTNLPPAMVPEAVPSSLARWVEESCVLDAQSLYDCVTLIKDEIIMHILNLRNHDIGDRREKRKYAKEVRQRAEEAKKKEKEEREKAKAGSAAATAAEGEETGAAPSSSIASTVASPAASNSAAVQEGTEVTSASSAPTSTVVTSEQTTSEQHDEQADSAAPTSAASSPPNTSTPVNTPVATRPESPFLYANEEDGTAAAAAQSGDVSLIEDLNITEGEGDSTASAPMDLTIVSSPDTSRPEAMETSEVGVDSTQQDTTTPAVESQQSTAPETAAASGTSAVAASSSGQEATGSAAAGGQVMEGVDPSFLAALPADIRQEVIREQLTRSRISNAAADAPGEQGQEASGVSAEFLAALPPNIQQEVLEQERRERSRNTATSTTNEQQVDPTTFIQTLPPDLRQTVLSDMDESLVAMLSEDLAEEAMSLRTEAERRLYRTHGYRSNGGGGGGGTGTGGGSRIRHRSGFMDGPLPPWGSFGSFSNMRRRHSLRPSMNQSNQSSQTFQSRQVLDHESLSCLLLLLFVEDNHLNTSVLHRVFRNVCYHSSTRDWLVSTLVSILQRSGDTRANRQPSDPTLSMEPPPAPPASKSAVPGSGKFQKQFPKKSSMQTSSFMGYSEQHSVSGSRNTSWMSIRLEGALGSRASIFQVERLQGPPALPSSPHTTTPSRKSSALKVHKKVFIHPQAAPVVCRHAIDALTILSKIFPADFVSTSSLLQHMKCQSQKSPEERIEVESDFWDILMRLDGTSPAHKKKLGASSRHSTATLDYENNPVQGPVVIKGPDQLASSWLSLLMRMLSHPVVKRSQQLTDRMLRLLSQISRNIAPPASPAKQPAANAGTGEAGASGAASESGAADQSATGGDDSGSNRGETSSANTATMGANAGTSNTSTIGRPAVPATTNTTDSLRSQGSITTTSEAPKTATSSHQRGKETAGGDMRQELSVAVGVLTSHACSEEGLEDATSLLLQLSKSAVPLRSLIITLLLEGAQKLGEMLAQQIEDLHKEILSYNGVHLGESSSPSAGSSSSSVKGQMVNRFDQSLTVVLSAKDKFRKIGRELQLPSMQPLTTKTSRQAFFLRILKVILQLQQSANGGSGHPIISLGQPQSIRSQIRRWRRSNANPSVSQFEAEALLDILGPPSRSRPRPLTADRGAGASNAAASSNQAAAAASSSGNQQETAESTEEKETANLSDRLHLDGLWDMLGDCLKELARSHDQHAVLVLQPAVEAFFLVHSSDKTRSGGGGGGNVPEQETREQQLAHIHEQQPVSPGQPVGTASEISAGMSSQSSLIDASMPLNTQKFLKFAETHRTVLNQILRQSTIPLSEGPFAVLTDHTRVLDFDVKRRYFRQELDRAEESSIRRDDVALRVRRSHLFEDSFRELHRRSPPELRSRLYVVFDGEDGQDAGGVLREWYLVISREIFNPNYALFKTSPGDHGTYTINPSSNINSNHLSYFKFVGRIVAKAVYDNKLLECYFTRSFYKHILGKPVKYQDMESEDFDFARSLKYVLENPIETVGSDLFFCLEVNEFGKTETRDLKTNGQNVIVTEKNKREYVYLVCQEKMTGAIKKQLAAFLEGFYEIIPKRLISIFDEQELELLISGLPNVDIDDLRQNTEYHKYQPHSIQIQWFWRALRSFDQAHRAKFLQFATGTSKVPLQGFAALEGMTGVQKFQIHRDDRSTSRLPCAHTCFNQLDLPAYETYDKLRERLLLAITECTEGFGLA